MSVLTTKCLEKDTKTKNRIILYLLLRPDLRVIYLAQIERVDEFDNPHMYDVSQLLLPNCNSVDYSSVNHYYYFFISLFGFIFLVHLIIKTPLCENYNSCADYCSGLCVSYRLP
jgi:hypothetical protein